jgi:hypothetical protein
MHISVSQVLTGVGQARVIYHLVSFLRTIDPERSNASLRAAASPEHIASIFAHLLLHSGENDVTVHSALGEQDFVLALLKILPLPERLLEQDRAACERLSVLNQQPTRSQASTPEGEELPFFEAVAKAAPAGLLHKATRQLRLPPASLCLDVFKLPAHKIPAEYSIEHLDRRQERAFAAGLACMLTAKLDFAPSDVPVATLIANDCELLRAALLTGQSPATLERLRAEGSSGAASLREELEKQAWLDNVSAPGSLARGVMLKKRQSALLATLRARPAYRAVFKLARLRAVGVSPVGGWPSGIKPELALVIRALGPDLDPEEAFITTRKARVNVESGEVAWGERVDNGELVLDLPAHPTSIQFELAFGNADAADMSAPRLGKGQLPPVWVPELDADNAQSKHATVCVDLSMTTVQIEEAHREAASVGHTGPPAKAKASRMMGMLKHKTTVIANKAAAEASERLSERLHGHSVGGLADPAQQSAILTAFFAEVEPEVQKTAQAEGQRTALLDAVRGEDGSVSATDFKVVCKDLKLRYQRDPIDAWEAVTHLPPALVTFDYSFEFEEVAPCKHDWASGTLRGTEAPDTAPWNYYDDRLELFRTLAHFLLPCNFALGVTADMQGQRKMGELESVATEMGLGEEMLEDALRAHRNDPAAVLAHLRQVQSERDAARREYEEHAEPVLSLEEDTGINTVQIDAVDWLLEDFGNKFGVPVTYRKLTELLVLSTQFEISPLYLMRLKTTLQAVNAASEDQSGQEAQLYEVLRVHLSSSLEATFRRYKAYYKHTRSDCVLTAKLATSVYRLLCSGESEEPWHEHLQAALTCWPAMLQVHCPFCASVISVISGS